MPQCQFPIFCCFWFQKSYTGNILGIGRNNFSYFLYFGNLQKTEEGPERSDRGPTPCHGAPLTTRWGEEALLEGFRPKNFGGFSRFPEGVPYLRRHAKHRRSDQKLRSGTLPGRGIGGDHRHHHHHRFSIDHPCFPHL